MMHMVKLVVGLSTPEELAAHNAVQIARDEERTGVFPFVRTRFAPKQEDEILDGGSIYRVFGGMILCRQKVRAFRQVVRDDGTTGTLIITEPDVVLVSPRPMRPFQGWRYLRAEDAPPDLQADQMMRSDLPAALRRDLAALCLL